MNASRVVMLAYEMSHAFESRTRDSGSRFRSLKDGSPEWMTEVIHHAHGEMLPDDHRYAFVEEAVDAVAALDAATVTEDAIEDAKDDLQADIYTHELLGWLGSRADRYCYVDEATELHGHSSSVIGDISNGQITEKLEVFALVVQALNTYAGQIDEEAANV
jgi:hypothetical protein